MYINDIYIDDLKETDIKALVENKVRESKTLEYKRQLNISDDKEKGKLEFLYDITALYNTDGGCMVFGIEEEKDDKNNNTGYPSGFFQQAFQNQEKTELQIQSIVRSNTAPNITQLIVRFVKINELAVLVIGVPKGLGLPVMVTFNDVNKFYRRNATNKYPVDVYELNQLFMQQASVREKAAQFKTQRIQDVLGGTIYPGLELNGSFFLHAIPMAFQNEKMIDLSLLNIQTLMNIFMQNIEKLTGTGSFNFQKRFGNFAKLFLIINIFFAISMKPSRMGYRVISTKDCMKYIQENGLNLNDNNWDYSIPSGKGLIYTLPNGETALTPTSSDDLYPSIIFDDVETFERFASEDFFPIGVEYMSWLEAHTSDINRLGIDNSFYTSILEKELGVKTPLTTIDNLENTFDKMLLYVRNPAKSQADKEAIVNCYGLVIIQYLTEYKKYNLEVQKRYEIYNPYSYPFVKNKERPIDVITSVYIVIKSKSKQPFKLFCDYVSLL